MKKIKKSKTYEMNSVSDFSSVCLHIIFILFSCATILPFLLVISVSFSSEASILYNGYKFIPEEFSLEGYKYLFTQTDVGNAYFITIASTVVGTLINVLAISLYAYPLSRRDFPYKTFFSNYIVVTMLFSGGLVPSYIINTMVLGLKNSFWALIIPTLGGGFNVFITRTYYKASIPHELIESSTIDGAKESTTFFKIVLPLSVPVMAVIALNSTFAYWNNWTSSLYYITDERLYTLQYIMQSALRNMTALTNNEMNLDSQTLQEMMSSLPTETVRMAMVIAGIGPIIFAYPFFQKYFIKGLTVGAVKG